MSLNTRAKFLLVVSILFMIYSILWGLAPYTSINLPSRFILDIADWPLDNLSNSLDKNTMFLSAIGAGLLGAISIFLAGIVVPAIKTGNTSIINTTITAMIFWFLFDSSGSIASGVVSNVFFNSIYLVLVLIPLIGIKKI
jgi:hypothetical protein